MSGTYSGGAAASITYPDLQQRLRSRFERDRWQLLSGGDATVNTFFVAAPEPASFGLPLLGALGF